MALTVKELAKRERVSRQAIRARIHRIPGFKDKFTKQGKNHERLVSNTGAKILHQHRNRPHKYFTVDDKRLLESKLSKYKALNNNLEYQLKHSDKTAVMAQMKLNIKDLRATADDLRNDKNKLNDTISKLQNRVDYLMYQNQQLTYYQKTNWIERLFGMKRNLKRIPASTDVERHKDNK